ncbi:MAG: hypothetical protein ABL866_14270 [Devosia sp.]
MLARFAVTSKDVSLLRPVSGASENNAVCFKRHDLKTREAFTQADNGVLRLPISALKYRPPRIISPDNPAQHKTELRNYRRSLCRCRCGRSDLNRKKQSRLYGNAQQFCVRLRRIHSGFGWLFRVAEKHRIAHFILTR